MILPDGVWYQAEMHNYPGRKVKCVVQMNDGLLRIRYAYNRMQVTYSGGELGVGHFRLNADVVSGRATLHHFSGDNVLEGSWEEDGATGMWRIVITGPVS